MRRLKRLLWIVVAILAVAIQLGAIVDIHQGYTHEQWAAPTTN